MELKNFYRLVFNNQQEYFVESVIEETDVFLKKLNSSGFSKSDYITLQIKNSSGDPVYIKSNELFSVQKAREGIVGAQTKLWRLL